MGKKSREKKERKVRRQHFWLPGQYPGDDDRDDPNVEYVNLGKLIEADAAAAPKPALWTPRNVAATPSGMPCPNCGDDTYIVDAKTPKEILEPFGYQGEHPPEEKVLALGCNRCQRIVMQLRESMLPARS